MSSKLLFKFDENFKKTIIGTDEAGRGPGAGGVFAAAVYFPEVTDGLIADLAVLNDSKKLTKKKRESIYDTILGNTLIAPLISFAIKLFAISIAFSLASLAASGVNSPLFLRLLT